MSDLIYVGEISGRHGTADEVKLKTTDAQPDWLSEGQTLTLKQKAGRRELALSIGKVVFQDDYFARVTFEGLSGDTAIDPWLQAELWLDRFVLPAIQEADTYRRFELLGLDVYIEYALEPCATVEALSSTTAGISADADFLELKMSTSGKVTILPFSEQFIAEVNIAEKRLVVRGLDDFLMEENTIVEKKQKKPTPYQRRKLKRLAAKEEATSDAPTDV